MKKFVLPVTLTLGLFLLLGPSAVRAQSGGDAGRDANPGNNPKERRGQTTMKFLSVSLNARAAAMGGAMVSQETGATAMFYNPAGMARMENVVSVTGGQVQWIAGLNYTHAGIAFKPAQGRFGVIGFNVRSGDYGDFLGTVRNGNVNSGYEDTGTFSPNTFSAGLGYAKVLGSRFSIGANLKYAMQDLGSTQMGRASVEGETGAVVGNKESALVADFGMLYRTGWRGVNFAAAVRNFSREVSYAEKNVELPLQLQIGMSMDMVQATGLNPDMHALTVAVDARRPRDFDTNVKFGGEYVFMNTLALRAGYAYPSGIAGANLGAGLHFEVSGVDLQADYAFTSYETFDNVNRISLSAGL